jgi:hypothetical protein
MNLIIDDSNKIIDKTGYQQLKDKEFDNNRIEMSYI